MYYLNLTFFIFLLFTCVACFNVPVRARVGVLLIASLIFVAWSSPYQLAWLIPMILINDICARAIQNKVQKNDPKRAKKLLVLTVILNLVAMSTLRILRISYYIPDPLGLSFITLIMIGHAIEIFRGTVVQEGGSLKYALFCSFFSTCTAGPIERSYIFLPQLSSLPGFHAGRVRSGLTLILIGCLKKVILSNTMGTLVSVAQWNPESFSGPALYLVSIVARAQLLFDIGAFTDIGRGSARLFGIQLSKNFNRPFAAQSFLDFWRRWHITLSTWLRDYVFYPLLGSPWSRLGVNASILLSFSLIGLWHSFSINMLLFGVIHGILMILDPMVTRMIAPLPPNIRKWIGWSWGWGFCASIPMFLFVTPNWEAAVKIYKRILVDTFMDLNWFKVYIPTVPGFYIPQLAMFALLLGWMLMDATGGNYFRLVRAMRRKLGRAFPVLYFGALWFAIAFGSHFSKSFLYRDLR